MRCLWIFMVIFISSSFQVEDVRYENTEGIKYKGLVEQCAFHTKITDDGKYEIKSLSGSVMDESNRVSKFDKEFPFRAFRIAIGAEENIVINMEVGENCFFEYSFQLPCLCYDDIYPPSYSRYQNFGGDILKYCGDKQSMICYDFTRAGPVVSSNPTVLKSGAELFEKNKGFYYNVSKVEEKLPPKFTFTINKDTPDKVDLFSSDVNKGAFKISKFSETEGYYDHDSKRYKVISVLPVHIFDPTCQVTWTFNGKPVEHLHNNVEFYATNDKREYFVADKRTKFTKLKNSETSKNETSTSDAAPSTKAAISVSFIALFFFNLCIYV